MSSEFLDYVEDILDEMKKAETLLEGDLQVVWDVVKQDIPRIKPQIEQILVDYQGQE